MSRSESDPIPRATDSGFNLSGLFPPLPVVDAARATPSLGETTQVKYTTSPRTAKKTTSNPLDSSLISQIQLSPSAESDLGKQISTKYDQLNQLWSSAEESLRQFLVPYEVEYCYQSYVDTSEVQHVANNLKTKECIGWARVGTQWRICVAAYLDYHSGEDSGPYIDWKPITESAIWYRQHMVKHFPKLKEKVIEAAKKNLRQLEEAIAELGSMLM